MKILLIEDEDDLRVLMREELVLLGHAVCEAENSSAAVGALGDQEFDLVIVDVRLRGGNGLQLVDQLASGKFGAPPKTVVITGDISPSIQDHCDPLGVPVMLKPFQMVDLITKVTRELEPC